MQTLENELTGLIYESILNDDAWPALMRLLVERLNLRSACVTTLDRESGYMASHFDAGVVMTREYMELYADRYMKSDMLLQGINDAAPGTFISTTTHMDMAQIVNSDFYQQWALPQGIHSAAAAALSREGKWFTFMMLHRGKEHPDFTDADVALFQHLAPHFQRAIQMRARVLEMRENIQDLRALIDRFPVGVTIFDEHGRIGQSNALALDIMEQHPAFKLIDQRLILTNQGDSRAVGLALINAIHASLGLREYTVETFHLNRFDDPLTLIVNPFRVKESDRMIGRALVMFYCPRFTARPSPEALTRLYNLTMAEARLCSALVSGDTLDEIAMQQGKKKETLRSHLKNIFMKTGSKRQAELVAQILTSPAMLPQL